MRPNVVERFYYWASERIGDPAALRATGFNRLDAPVAVARVVVACVDDDGLLRYALEEPCGKFVDRAFGDCDDDYLGAAHGFVHVDRVSARLRREVAQRRGTT